MKHTSINISDIDIGSRKREDKGDIEDLAASIKERGLISPIAVVEMPFAPPEVILDSTKPYLLLAGERRVQASLLNGATSIAAQVFDRVVDELDLRCIEFAENVKRKDFSWQERAAMELEIHRLFTSKFGTKAPLSQKEEGWSVSATAEFLGRERTVVSDELKLAEAVEVYPELFEKCKNKSEASKLLQRIEEKAIIAELAGRKTSIEGWKRKLIDCYIVRDAFEGMHDLLDGLFHLVEIDPPFNIDYVGGMQQSTASTRIAVHRYKDLKLNAEAYGAYLDQILKEAYRLLASDGWLLVWFAPEPWFELVYQAIVKAGFDGDRLWARWGKGTSGQNIHPDLHLTRVEESFFYARKGNPRIMKVGRNNTFDYNRPHHSERAHPNEKPIDLMTDIFSTFVAPRSRILIPFAGSGNGLIAAHQLNMEAIGFDNEASFKNFFSVKVMGL